MTPAQWEEVEDNFHKARSQPAESRATFLRQACSTDTVRVEVECLLSAYERAGHELSQPILGDERFFDLNFQRVAEDLFSNHLKSNGADEGELNDGGRTIGSYRLVEKIGEGGMGEVWIAEQRQPVRRRVALKLIKTGMNTHEVVARFESERQALALMDHPAIAKVFEAGSSENGHPFFVMEYVPGVAITKYCDEHKLTTRRRLELFIQVCEGVQHAHQKAIIHRDLKPANILVSEVDGKPVPRIIDFGIAKATSQPLTEESTFTRTGVIIGTPDYMSPEQAQSGGTDIDTRSDVYSLGIVLYELLVGALPLDFRKLALDEFLHRLREEDSPRPSSGLKTLGEESTRAAQNRGTDPVTLARLLRGDLDAISLKALEKNRTRRYATPLELAADIGRYLNDEAVLAVPPSASYRAGKFALRYRGVLTAVVVVVLVLILATGFSIRQSLRANREAAVAQAVNDFLRNDLLAQASTVIQSGSSPKPDLDLKVRTALDRAAARIAGKFNGQPEVEAAIRDTIGQAYVDLGLYPEAEKQLEREMDLQRRVLGAENPKTLKTNSHLGVVAESQGKYRRAEAIFSQTLESQRRLLGVEHQDTLFSMNELAVVYHYEGKYAQAEALHIQILAIRRRERGNENQETLSSMNNLAGVYVSEGKYPQAEALFKQTLEIQSRVLGAEHPNTLHTINNLAWAYEAEGKYSQAEALFSRSLTIERRVLGTEHPSTLGCINNLATVYGYEGKYPQAEVLFSQTLEVKRRVLGTEHPSVLSSMNNLATIYRYEGKYPQAETLFSQTLVTRRHVLGAEHRGTLASMRELAAVYIAQGRNAQAKTLLNETLEIGRRVEGPERPDNLQTLSYFASLYLRQGKYLLAESYSAQTLAGRRHAFGSEHPDTMDSAADLALAYQAQGKFAESEPLARESFDFDQKKRPDDWQRFRDESLLGANLAGQKKYVEAEPLLLEGYRGMVARKERIGVPDWYYLDRAREWVGQLYKAWGKPTKAAEFRKQVRLEH